MHAFSWILRIRTERKAGLKKESIRNSVSNRFMLPHSWGRFKVWNDFNEIQARSNRLESVLKHFCRIEAFDWNGVLGCVRNANPQNLKLAKFDNSQTGRWPQSEFVLNGRRYMAGYHDAPLSCRNSAIQSCWRFDCWYIPKLLDAPELFATEKNKPEEASELAFRRLQSVHLLGRFIHSLRWVLRESGMQTAPISLRLEILILLLMLARVFVSSFERSNAFFSFRCLLCGSRISRISSA